MKKIFSLMLALMLCVSLAATAGAAEKVAEGFSGDVAWVLDSDGVLTISGNGAMGSASWEGYSITSVVINEGVTSIGNNAFRDCSSLTRVSIPGSVTTIGNTAFYSCSSLTTVIYHGTNEPTIGRNAFSRTSDFKIYVPESYTNPTFGGVPVTTFGTPDPVTLTVQIQPNNLNVEEGKIIEGTHFEVTASDNSTPSYQWYQCDDANKTNARKLEDAASESFYVPKNLTEGQYYFYCVASAEGAESVTSNVLKVTVRKPYLVTITADPAEGGTVDAKVGSSSVTQAIQGTPVSLIATPADGYLFKEWQVVSGSVMIANDRFTMGSEDVEIKAIFEKKVDAQKPVITAQPSGASYTEGAQSMPLRVTASVTDGGTLSYQWYEISEVMGKLIPGADQPTFTPPTDTVGEKEYRCFVTNTNNDATGEKIASVWSDFAKVVVVTAPVVPQTGDSTPIALLALLTAVSLAGAAMNLSRKRRMN